MRVSTRRPNKARADIRRPFQTQVKQRPRQFDLEEVERAHRTGTATGQHAVQRRSPNEAKLRTKRVGNGEILAASNSTVEKQAGPIRGGNICRDFGECIDGSQTGTHSVAAMIGYRDRVCSGPSRP